MAGYVGHILRLYNITESKTKSKKIKRIYFPMYNLAFSVMNIG